VELAHQLVPAKKSLAGAWQAGVKKYIILGARVRIATPLAYQRRTKKLQFEARNPDRGWSIEVKRTVTA
jgi:hypothetical protein